MIYFDKNAANPAARKPNAKIDIVIINGLLRLPKMSCQIPAAVAFKLIKTTNPTTKAMKTVWPGVP